MCGLGLLVALESEGCSGVACEGAGGRRRLKEAAGISACASGKEERRKSLLGILGRCASSGDALLGVIPSGF